MPLAPPRHSPASATLQHPRMCTHTQHALDPRESPCLCVVQASHTLAMGKQTMQCNTAGISRSGSGPRRARPGPRPARTGCEGVVVNDLVAAAVAVAVVAIVVHRARAIHPHHAPVDRGRAERVGARPEDAHLPNAESSAPRFTASNPTPTVSPPGMLPTPPQRCHRRERSTNTWHRLHRHRLKLRACHVGAGQ